MVDQNGLSIFELLRYRRHDHAAVFCAFDVIAVEGWDLRREPIEQRKQLSRRTSPEIAPRHCGR